MHIVEDGLSNGVMLRDMRSMHWQNNHHITSGMNGILPHALHKNFRLLT